MSKSTIDMDPQSYKRKPIQLTMEKFGPSPLTRALKDYVRLRKLFPASLGNRNA